jgi:hypothetical protein
MNTPNLRKKPCAKKGILIALGILFLLCAGIIWEVTRESNLGMNCLTGIPSAETSTTGKNYLVAQKDNAFATFSEPSVYFTFDYPAGWTYRKTEEPYGEGTETYWNFYEKGKETADPVFMLHYPMYESAFDTCLKFEDTADYTLDRFVTNDPQVYVTHLDCQKVAQWPEADKKDLGSNIFLERTTMNDEGEPMSQGGARMHWWKTLDGSLLEHIARSIRVK